MSFNQVYTELLVILPASVIHEAWIRLTTRKRNPLSVSDASGVNSMVELFLKHEVERYQKKLARQKLTVKQTYMPRNRMIQDIISEEVSILQKHLLEYNKVTFGRFMQNLTKEHEKLIKTNHQIRHEIDTMKKQVREIEKKTCFHVVVPIIHQEIDEWVLLLHSNFVWTAHGIFLLCIDFAWTLHGKF
ncbi:hypothetical protein GLOIN_2v1826331 [Rhizophagus irregularis DAOM 181602=DAOM 197198]|nr:hypothetical protein GLOIN_2v1826331 [Rhizophagus irregularis DAOM 181602=DAOM 197198]